MENLDVIALGGNAILPAGKAGTIGEQFEVTRTTMQRIVELVRGGRRVVITHGNGPIVGNIVLRNEAASRIVPPMPLDICGADSQGGIGYMIQQTLRNLLVRAGIGKEVVALVTQVVVDENDEAFADPTKPIGPFYNKQEAERLSREKGWKVVEDSHRGYRRVVPSPKPLEIVERCVVENLVAMGVIVITVGGGGVPVVRRNGRLEGVEAVIDKDLASSVLAVGLGARRLIIVTDVDAVYESFGTAKASPIRELPLSRAEELLAQGELPPGSMGSKVEAIVDFLRSGGELGIIAHAHDLEEALAGKKGTRLFDDSRP